MGAYCTCRCLGWVTVDGEEQDEEGLIVVGKPALAQHGEQAAEDCLSAGIELQPYPSHSEDSLLLSQIEAVGHQFECLLSAPFSDLELILDVTDCQVYSKDTSRGFLMRSEWVCKHSPEKVRKFIGDLETRRKWDKHIESVECVKRLGERVGVYYQMYKRIFPLAQRDLLIVNKEYEKGDTLFDVSCSVSLATYPESSSIVRAQVFLGGYSMRSIPDTQSTHISCISELNFGGSVPKVLVKKVSAIAVPAFIRNIDTAIRENTEI